MLSRYRILDRLGAGGMGVVYRAEDVSLKRPVALKFLSGTPFSQKQTRARFLREARTAAALNHPAICTIYEVGEVEPGAERTLGPGEHLEAGAPFIAMELVEGKTLEEIVRQTGVLPFNELLGISLQVAEGMAAAHGRGIVHRDLKPGNVMVTKEGRVKILDFGLAKPLEPAEPGDAAATAAKTASAELTREGRVMGTAAYMSPEQAKGEPLDSRSDIFSFGVMLYELATGMRPFRGTTTLSTLAKIIETEPEPISEARVDLPPELRRIIRRCLQKRPEDRYNDTRDLVAALKALRQETTSGAQRIVSGAVAQAPARGRIRRWGRWAVVSAAVALLAAAAILFAVRSGLSRRPRASMLPSYRQITYSGNAYEPIVSPDGQFVAYVEEGEAAGQRIMLQDLAGGKPLLILESERASVERWSPDGSELIVGTAEGIWLVPRLGGTRRRLPLRGYMAWSPDGKRIASVTQPAREITITEMATSQPRAVPVDVPRTWFEDLDWSPAGDLLAFATEDDRGRTTLWTLPVGGERPNRIVDADSLRSPRFSPHGDALYYLSRQEGGEAAVLWKARIDPESGHPTGEPSVVLSALEIASDLTIARSGKKMLFSRMQGQSNLWLAEPDGRTASGIKTTQLTSGTHSDYVPRFSPDGRSIAFVRDSHVFVLRVGAAAPEQLTFGEPGQRSPAWSPDGREIAFIAVDEGVPRVFKMSATGENPRPFKRTIASGDLTWAPGKRILYQKPGNRNYSLLDPVTEQETPLLRDESRGWLFAPVYSPDATRVAAFWNRKITPDKRERGARVVSLDDTVEKRLAADLSLDSYPVGWSADGAWVYLMTWKETHPVIAKAPAAGGPAIGVIELPFRNVSMIGSTDNGSRFIVSVVDKRSDVWMVENFDPEME